MTLKPSRHAPRLAPRAPSSAAPRAGATADPRLVRITRDVLEQLKHPAAIPSQVVMQALQKAVALPR